MTIEPGTMGDLYYRNGESAGVLRAVIIRSTDDHGMIIFSPYTKDHQWLPYSAIIRMIIIEPSEADMM